MGRYILRRLAAILIIGLAIVFFCALGLEMMRRSSAAGAQASLGAVIVRALRQTRSYVRSLVTGNLGMIWQAAGRSRTSVAVTSLLLDTYTKSMGLLLISLLFASVLGIGTGVFAAYFEGSVVSSGLLTGTLLGISLPTFFTAVLLQVLEIVWYQRTGIRLVPVGGFGWDSHVVLPALVLAARPLAQLARVTCISLSEAAHQDYVRTAWAKGLPIRRVWGDHVLPNAAVPILTALGVSMRFSLGSLPVVEFFFGWPGIGVTLLNAIRSQQLNLVTTLALALGLTFMLVNLLLDLAFRAIDPRLRVSTQ